MSHMSDVKTLNLTGDLLVAMPGMSDTRFARSVILICAHSPEGAMGLIINKRVPNMVLGDLLEQMDIKSKGASHNEPVYFGGPVETARGFVLHSNDYTSRLKTLSVGNAFGMTATLDVLEDIALGEGPKRAQVMLGYAGWGYGQLEAEIMRNGWLTVEANPDLVFGSDEKGKWIAAVKSLGIDPLRLSETVGHA